MVNGRVLMKKRKITLKIISLLAVLLFVNLASRDRYLRFDLTQDKRYTLSSEVKQMIRNLKEPISIKVYLQGDFPAEFKRLQAETKQFLEELRAVSNRVQFRFIDPGSNTRGLIEKGLQPSRLTVQQEGKVSEALIFPWALITYQGKEEKVSLLSQASAQGQEKQLQNSIENLEYEFAHAIHKISAQKEKKVAIIKGNGELEDLFLFSFLRELGQYYHLAPFTLDSVDATPQRTLTQLKAFDLAIVAKPTQAFSDNEKYCLDQFVMNGGKTLWMIDNVIAETDSLMRSGQSIGLNRDLQLTDLFFSYGVRPNYNLTQDLFSSKIRLASGNLGNQVDYQDFPWYYHPLVIGNPEHPISKNLDPILLKYPSSLDTLDNGISKKVLLSSSPYGRIIGTPTEIRLDEIAQEVDQGLYSDANVPFALLLEGAFDSAYKNRVKPFEIVQPLDKGVENRMIVISDGDVAANEVIQGEPLSLDKDKWTNQPYGNLGFLMNSAHFLLDQAGIVELRGKTIDLQFLNKERAYGEKFKWQMINLVIPLSLLLLFGICYQWLRKRANR